MTKLRLASAFLALLLLLPQLAYAQADPGQDPFALTPEKLRLFQGYEASGDQAQSLFNGDEMKDNGLFSQQLTQLGGSAPPPVASTSNTPPPPPTTDPEANNGQQGNFVMISSKYEPNQLLTHEIKIAVTVTVKNVSDHPIDDILFTAKLKDQNADLLEDPKPIPTLDKGPDLGEAIEEPLVWKKFDLKPQESKTFKWSIQAHEDDSILRWTFTAEFGAGQSILLLWMPIQNPNPVGNQTPGSGAPGIPSTCASSGTTTPYPGGSPASAIAAIQQKWGIQMQDGSDSWSSSSNAPFIQYLWEALSSVECTSYLGNVTKDGPLVLVAMSVDDWWWGYQIEVNQIQFNMHNIVASGAMSGSPESVHQLIIHELGHVFRSKNFDIYSQYEGTLCGSGSPTAYMSAYGATNCSEDFSEAIAYYAIRAAHEWMSGPYCSSKNPYDRGQSAIYNFIKTNVFGGKTFGQDPPTSPQPC